MTKRTPTKAERSRSTAAAETVEALELLPLEYVQLIRDHARNVSRIAAQRGELEGLTGQLHKRKAAEDHPDGTQ